MIAEEMRVVDVGGGASPFARADYVIDGITYDERGKLDAGRPRAGERFSRDTWVRLDLCDRAPWPFPDKFFDYAVCSHLLEDVRDPVWVCAEIRRVAKAGYIETPSRAVEQSKGVEHPLYAGYYHHRWLVSAEGKSLLFRMKPHSIHTLREAIVAEVGVWRRINPRYETLSFEWQGSFEAREILDFDETSVNRELERTAKGFRTLNDLLLPSQDALAKKLKKWIYYGRLRRNGN